MPGGRGRKPHVSDYIDTGLESSDQADVRAVRISGKKSETDTNYEHSTGKTARRRVATGYRGRETGIVKKAGTFRGFGGKR